MDSEKNTSTELTDAGTALAKEPLYETLFRISQGDVELFKEETESFLTAAAAFSRAGTVLSTTEAEAKVDSSQALIGKTSDPLDKD